MAAKGWTKQVAAAAGVAAGTSAAQIGLGYGLGVVVWPAVATTDDSVWLGSLGWTTWIAASATVLGAVIAGRLGRATGMLWRFALSASAAVGALLTVALVALPAREAVRTGTFSPETIAGGYAVAGVVLGLVVAYWAVVSRPVAANLSVTAAWLWALAVAAVVMDVFWRRPSATYLASWQFAAVDTGGLIGTIYWPSALLTLAAAFAIGVLAAAPAARRGNHGIGTATSGAVGPLLIAASFFVLAPQLRGALGALESAYLIAPYAVLAGLAGSAAAVAVARQSAARQSARSARLSGESDEPAAVSTGRFRASGRSSAAARSSAVVPVPAQKAPHPADSSGAEPTASTPAPSTPAPSTPTADRPAPPKRSTVKPPPSNPPVAQIRSGGRSGTAAEEPPTAPIKKTAPAKKTPAARSTPTKGVTAKAPAPRKAPAKSTSRKPAAPPNSPVTEQIPPPADPAGPPAS
ncbi:Hansenula MRAKII killer toxin-resistant protein 1 [Symbioplanes lichenis]|uniref:Hansenula MRAKII killer toxin-resistant protein 1 n=1 Tax=Symbioplanes lichenis TaxID=1629072 RepID=UPI002739B697|nr:Hansenula MRAKII killer toxin-resistant protein 1 [Actinoplanes lichenis]